MAQLLGVTPVEGDRVDRALLLSCRAPRILHIATHGYYIPQNADARPNSILFSPTVLANPMLRSGIALAGANSHADGAGLLSAAEITGMDLRGTELVVVSACETGLGDVERGEGVSGMRRAFVVAGARRLVVSLWSVPDQSTAHLMRAFHTLLNRGQRVADALSDAQSEVRRSFPQPVHWAGWVLQGEIGALDGTGPSTTRARPTEAVHAPPPWTPAEQRGIARQLGEAAAHFNGGRGAHALVQAREVVARVEGIDHEEARPILVSALQIMAVGLFDTQPRESLAACLRALGVLEGIAERDADDQLILLEAVLLKTAGSVHRILGAPDRAVDCQTRAEIILERRLAQRESSSLSSELSSLYMNKANAVAELGQLRAAVGLYDRSLEVWDRLVAQKHPLAEAYSAKVRLFRADTLRSLGDEHIALADARAAVATLETLGPALQRPDLGNLITWAEQTFGPTVRQPAV